jgi:thiol-disulfide isomerase/thioredoxin
MIAQPSEPFREVLDMSQTRFSVRALALLLPALGLLAAATSAQAVPSDAVLRGFEPSGEYMLVVDNKLASAAEIYQNDKIPAFLIISSALPSPVMLTPRTSAVESVNLMKISKQKDGSVDLLADAVLAPLGQFQIAGESIAFSVQGKKASLDPKPALTGTRKGADLLASLPEYVRGSKGYNPNPGAIAALAKDGKPVVVHVVFGSWCPHCRQHVPMMLKVESQVKNPKIKFEYYGLGRPPDGWKDPEVKRLGVKGIPTAIVYVNGLEAGRIEAQAWAAPEVELNKIVNGPAAKGK